MNEKRRQEEGGRRSSREGAKGRQKAPREEREKVSEEGLDISTVNYLNMTKREKSIHPETSTRGLS